MASENGTFSYIPTTSGIYTWNFRMKNSGMVAQPASVYYLDNLVASYPIPYTRIDCDKGPNASYRYGFNGKENDMETLTQDYGFRIYNPALSRFLSVDPLTKSYPWYTPYQFAGSNPIKFIDLDGAEQFELDISNHLARPVLTVDQSKPFLNRVTLKEPTISHTLAVENPAIPRVDVGDVIGKWNVIGSHASTLKDVGTSLVSLVNEIIEKKKINLSANNEYENQTNKSFKIGNYTFTANFTIKTDETFVNPQFDGIIAFYGSIKAPYVEELIKSFEEAGFKTKFVNTPNIPSANLIRGACDPNNPDGIGMKLIPKEQHTPVNLKTKRIGDTKTSSSDLFTGRTTTNSL